MGVSPTKFGFTQVPREEGVGPSYRLQSFLFRTASDDEESLSSFLSRQDHLVDALVGHQT